MGQLKDLFDPASLNEKQAVSLKPVLVENKYYLHGPFSISNVKNLNNRHYSDVLWEKQLASESVQTMLAHNRMLGNLSHPDYYDVSMEEGAILIKRLYLADGVTKCPEPFCNEVHKKGELIGTAIPTYGHPKGEILVSLLKLGVEPGISSRGKGEEVTRGNEIWVNEDTYNLITFDLTMHPSFSVFPRVTSVGESKSQLLGDLKEKVDLALSSPTLSENEKSVIKKITESFDLGHSEMINGVKQACDMLNNKKEDFNMENSEVVRSLTESLEKKVSENVSLLEKITQLQQENMSLKDRLREAEKTANDYDKALGVVDRMAFAMKSDRYKMMALDKKIREQARMLDKADEVIKKISEEFRNLKKNHSRLLVQNLPGALDVATKVIEKMRDMIKGMKVEKREADIKLETATKALESVRKSLLNKEINAYLDKQLESVGGRKAHATVLKGVSTMTEAEERVKYILAQKKYAGLPGYTPEDTGDRKIEIPLSETDKKVNKIVENIKAMFE